MLVALAPGPALAQQLVAFDQVVTITERGNGAGTFHFLIKPAASEPASWTAPVNYSRGTAHVHLEVMEKPSKRNTAITICFDGNLEGYGCIVTGSYTDVGSYDTTRALPTATWQYEEIAWDRRRQEYHLVVKDPALGGTPGGRPASDYVPTKMRIVMTIVPPGGTYAPPPRTASPATDAGADAAAPDAGADPAPAPADAAMPDPAPPSGSPPPQDPPGAPPAMPPAANPPPGSSPPPSGTAPPPPAPSPTVSPGDTAASGGCSVARAGGSSVLLLLAAALSTALLRRRRRR